MSRVPFRFVVCLVLYLPVCPRDYNTHMGVIPLVCLSVSVSLGLSHTHSLSISLFLSERLHVRDVLTRSHGIRLNGCSDVDLIDFEREGSLDTLRPYGQCSEVLGMVLTWAYVCVG